MGEVCREVLGLLRERVGKLGILAKLRIGVNALFLIPGGVSGTEIYLRELLAALARIDSENQYFVFTNRETGRDLVPDQPNFICRPQALRARFRTARILWEQTLLPLDAFRCKIDVLFNPGFTAPVFAGCPSVTVFHDLLHLHQPRNFHWFEWPFWRVMLWIAAHRSDRLVAVSSSASADLYRFYGLPQGCVTVVSNGVERAFFDLDRSAAEDFVLCVSAILPHKNHARLIRAYGQRERNFRLVLVGVQGPYASEIEALIATLGLSKKIQMTGWIPRAEVHDLYRRARALIYPSTFEGFGLPVLEGMAAGLPVACSDIPSLREVAGDASFFFNPAVDDDVAAALDRIVLDAPLRARLAAEGPLRARDFTWERTARETLNVLTASPRASSASA